MRSFKIGSFNTLNLVRPGVFYYDDVFAIPNGDNDPANEYNQKIQWIGDTLDRTQLDIVGFQEIFSEEALHQALLRSDRFANADFRAPFTSRAENETTDAAGKTSAKGPRLAIASRFPIKNLTAHTDFPSDFQFVVPWEDFDRGTIEAYPIGISKFQRPVLRAEIEVTQDLRLIVYVAHLKSKRGTFFEEAVGTYPKESTGDDVVKALGAARSLVQRAAEAAALRRLIIDDLKAQPPKPVVVLGDLNDDLESVTTNIVRGTRPFPRSYQKLMDDPEKWAIINKTRWDRYLYSAHEIQASQSSRNVLFSHIFDSSYSVLDHILVSQELASVNPIAVAELSYLHVYNDHIYDSLLTDTRSRLRIQSDHGIPVADIYIKEKSKDKAPADAAINRQA